MQTEAVILIQKSLFRQGFDPGRVDGELGGATCRAVQEALVQADPLLPALWQGWQPTRQSVAYLQLLCKDRGIDVGGVDGFWGPQTSYACDTLVQLLETGEMPPPWRDDLPRVNPNGWPQQSESALNEFFGNAGSNQVALALPYPHRLSWDLSETIDSYQCNAKVHDSAKRALTRVFDHYGMERIRGLRLDRWGGCLKVRKMRGGTQWSLHSCGGAIDIDPDNNRLNWGRDRASLARPEYDAWWRFWEEEGWTSLGRTRNYDWMHLQATRL